MKNVLIFVAGAAAGTLVTWKLIEKKYKDLADEEIKSVVEHYRKKRGLCPNVDEDESVCEDVSQTEEENVEMEVTEEEVKEYKQAVEDLGYQYKIKDHVYDSAYMGDPDEVVRPFVIAPEDFGDMGYTTKTWSYYSDCILTDEDGEVVTDPTTYIGEALSHFGDYEDDAVHVRDVENEFDYEIIKYDTTYVEYKGN